MNCTQRKKEYSLICALTLSVALFFFLTGAIEQRTTPQLAENHTFLVKNDRGIVWNAQINFSEPGGKTDYIVFGEASDANDGPPADSYDVVKPPAPIPPYVRSWFDDNIPTPYDLLWKDYRHYPDTNKSWNMTIHWIPPGSSPTLVAMTWNKNRVNDSEYDSVYLINTTGAVVADLITTESYAFLCPPWVPQTYKINGIADTQPPIILNHSPSSGETGDAYTFNATVIDERTPGSKLMVKVDWVHGSYTGNDTMVYSGGDTFLKTIILNNYTTSNLTYHFYAEDSSKARNTNCSLTFKAIISDDEAPSISSTSGNVMVGTGDSASLWVNSSDNIGITSAIASVDSINYAMTWNSSALRWEYVYVAPSGSTSNHSYTVTVYDAALNSKTNGPYTLLVFDNDVPVIITDSTSVNVGTGDIVTLWVQAIDNIGVTSAKATIDAIDYAMTWNSSALRWEYVYVAPSGSTSNHSYTVTVYDAALNWRTNGPYTITVFDNDAPLITNMTATPHTQVVNGLINITATVTDNINVQTVKVRINGPAGFLPLNVSMNLSAASLYWINQSYLVTGTYNYSLWVVDYNNNHATSLVHQFSVYAEIPITTLLSGWNFISIPFNQTITKTDLLILYNENEYSWSEGIYQGLVLASIFDWNRSGQTYLLTNSLVPGRGYWVYAYYEIELWATGLNPSLDTDYITSLLCSWNIIGLPVNQTMNKTSLWIHYLGVDYNWTQATTNQNPTGEPLIVSDLFGWRRTLPQGYIIPTTLDAGNAYWIYAYYPCTIKQ